jgi:glucan biosynthesis protein C
MQTDMQTVAADAARLHSLDAVRAFALLLGVVLHATLSFFTGYRIWLVDDVQSSTALTLLFFVIHMLRMLTFFLLAGFVARISFQKLGAARFFRDRAKRIGIPLLAGWPPLFAAIVAGVIVGAVIANGGALPADRPPPQGYGVYDFPLAHLWFLYFLALFYAALALLRPLFLALDRHTQGWIGRAADCIVGFLLRQWAPVLLAAPLCLALYLHPYWVMWFGIPTPDKGFVPQASPLVAYGGAFLFGWLAQRQAGVLALWERRWLPHLLLAVGMTIVCIAMAGIEPVLIPVPQGLRKFAYAACYSIGAWSWAFALLGMALRFLSGYSAMRRYLADASYWIYLVHLPLLILLQAFVSQLAWPWFVKFPLILAVAFALMLASYAWLVRGTWIGVVLNGKRKPHARVAAVVAVPGAGRA